MILPIEHAVTVGDAFTPDALWEHQLWYGSAADRDQFRRTLQVPDSRLPPGPDRLPAVSPAPGRLANV